MRGSGRVSIFVVQIAWLVVLGILAGLIFFQPSLLSPGDFLGSVPFAVIWFGSLGAVLISLTGIVEHAKDWDESYALWHISRPLVGASLAVVAVLIIQAGVLAIGSTPTAGPGVPKNLLYYLVAFLVGYREETFRDLIKRLVDLILAPATAGPATTITGLDPASGAVAGQVPIVISGSGFTNATAVTFGSNAAQFRVDSDSQITATLPSAATAGKVTVSVRGKARSATASFSYTGAP
jgi:hypothetical protein